MLPTPKLSEQEMLDRVLHRDGLMLIVNKPPGIPVHAGPKGGSNFEMYFQYLQYGLPNPPGLAHRIDRDTSGCLILGRHRKALAKLGKLFQSGRIEKTYWAVCVGAPKEASGVVELSLRKRTHLTTSWWMETCQPTDEGAMASVTHYKVLTQSDGLSLIEFSPKTGRTHQVRVHGAAIGCPLLGERIYGELPDEHREVPLHLHARAVRVPISQNKEPVYAEAPLPPHMEETLEKRGLAGR